MTDKYKLSGWEYSMDSILPMRFSVYPNPNEDCPNELMKYYKINKYSIESLTNGYFYASHPFQLNDPFECFRNLLDFENVSFETYKKYYCSMDQNPEERVRRLFDTEYEKLKLQFMSDLHDDVFSKMGIISLTSNPCDMLMWAHYSNHDGFLAIFDVEKLVKKFHGPFPINYKEKADKFDINISPHLAIFYMTNIKSKSWSYEKEWRLIAETDSNLFLPHQPNIENRIERQFPYSKGTLKEIVLGFNFNKLSINKVTKKDGFVILDFKGLEDADFRVTLLDFIIQNNITVSSIHLFENLEFKLIKKELELKYFDKYEYGFKIKHVA
ncbi:MAG: DUF2971 domain-containing protein [Bacteroidales bacterium]|nr:DUF2971 domain-containing protein [Bacteroidales bacterium]